jgi:hypothetical protein
MPSLAILPARSIARAICVTFAAVVLGACASIGEDECVAMDWRTVGYEDGAAGMGIDRLTWRRQACAKHGVVPDLEAYRLGRDEGLMEFCVPGNGFRVGAAGQRYSGACPDLLADEFLVAYEAGRQLWRLERRVDEALGGITARRNEMQRIDEMLSAASMIIVSADSTAETRAQALLDMKNLTDRRTQVAVEIDALERVLPDYEAELEAYRATLPYVGY